MITSLIVAIMITSAGFYFSAETQKAAADATINHLQQLIITAQLEAIKDNTPITICHLTNNKCSGDWNESISMFSDYQTFKQENIKTDENATLSFKGFPTTKYLTFTPLGLSGQQNGTFVYCAQYGNELILRGLSISKTGRVRELQQNDNYFKNTKAC